MRKQHGLKGKKKSPQAVENMRRAQRERWAAKKAAKAIPHTARDVEVYLKHALSKWPKEKKRGIARLYVELALATLEGKA